MDTQASIPRIDSEWKIDFDVDMGHGHLDFNLFPNRFQESIFHPLTRLQIPAQATKQARVQSLRGTTLCHATQILAIRPVYTSLTRDR
jgi:hypothetical protein